MEIEKNSNIQEVMQSPDLPYIFWIVSKDLEGVFINNLTGEKSNRTVLQDLLAVQMYKNELFKNGWRNVILPTARIIEPDGNITEIK